MKIFVLGAGRMGSVAAMDLARSKNSGIEIGVGDIDYGKAKLVAKQTGAKPFKADVTRIDDLSAILRRYDAIINASWYEFNLLVMKACLKAGCDYNDLGGLFHITRKQLVLDKQAKQAGISAIVGGGESPGITNVMALFCSSKLSKIERVRIFAGSRQFPKQKNDRDLVFPFSISTVIDEYSKHPVEFLNGKFVELPPLSGSEKVRFPNPVGVNTVHYSIHSEVATIPFTLGRGVKNVEFKLGVSGAMESALRPLIDMGFASEDAKIPIDGRFISPKQFLVNFFDARKTTKEEKEPYRYVCLRSEVTGTTGRKKRKVSADLLCGPRNKLRQANATAYLTGISASTFAQFLAMGRVKKGVIAPESAVDPDAFLSQLKARGVPVSMYAV
jgi:lysine 6-dehydrogenase